MFKIPFRTYVHKVRPFKERNRQTLALHRDKRLELAQRSSRPIQFEVPKLPPDPTVIKKERKLPPLAESALPYWRYSEQETQNNYGTFYDPLFNPHLHEERHRVDPNQEPFNAIYADSQSELANDYTKVRNITDPKLWSYVEDLARITIAPKPRFRKPDEPITPLPSGYVPPPEVPPELPYFVARTRNYLLPVYFFLDRDRENCTTLVKQVSGDLWKLEEDLRTHLEKLEDNKQRILTSVQETDERVHFKGRYLHQIVEWLYAKGF